MTFLPEEFRCTKERTGCLFPSYNAAPLIVELRKITVCVDNLFIMLTEKSFRCRTDAKTLLKLFLTAYSNPCTFGGKALNMVFFFLQKTFGNKHRHINILVTCFFETAVKVSLNIFPDSISVGADNHTALYARIVNELSFFNDVGVPFCKVLISACDSFNHFFVVCHYIPSVK